MPVLPDVQFTDLNLITGTVKNLQQEVLTPDDQKIFDRDYDLMANDLGRIVDKELGDDLMKEKNFYYAACQIAKGYFDAKVFGGLKPFSGQFGMRLIGPQDLKAASSSMTPGLYSWVQTLTTQSAKTYATYALGAAAAAAVFTSALVTQKSLLAWHRLISYKPAPRLMYVEWNINNVGYTPYDVEPYSKISSDWNKLYRTIPMPGRIIIHPGGTFYANFWFELNSSVLPVLTSKVDVEVALFGLVFAEYDYLKASANV